MGKRSDFEKLPRNYYPTPIEAVYPLFPHLPKKFTFIEPCAGDGRLIRHIESGLGGKCTFACDIEPQGPNIAVLDVLFFSVTLPPCDLIITNPPWDRDVLHPMIEKFTEHADTWLLFDADWMHTVQAAPYARLCKKIVSVGRIQWIPGTKNTGMDNCCWYFFSKDPYPGPEFIFRQ